MGLLDSINDLVFDSLSGDVVFDSTSSDLLYYNPPAQSGVLIRDGFLLMSYDGIFPVTVNSTFTFTANFETSVELRQSLAPVYFSVHNDFNTVSFKYYNGSYISSLSTADGTTSCWGELATDTSSSVGDQVFTDYICVSSQDIQNGYARPRHIIEDTCDVALNIIGGPPQDRGTDFVAESDKISWAGLELEDEIKAGDVLRVIYLAADLYGPVPVKIIVKDGIVTIIESKHHVLFKRAISNTGGQWVASFTMAD